MLPAERVQTLNLIIEGNLADLRRRRLIVPVQRGVPSNTREGGTGTAEMSGSAI